ncbi:hypothetical protein GCM10007094_41480 [Pseudovibrio japonicus]|uniref:Uncharacterized protein n=1 Tax=Pseudovibrio japonicus TaxID=366534 RepID=A0ABQ3ES43_9HYPH|nr:hypothetical protein GCM10007094_41480 [Pseudovibrio japonicus]
MADTEGFLEKLEYMRKKRNFDMYFNMLTYKHFLSDFSQGTKCYVVCYVAGRYLCHNNVILPNV